MWANRKFTHEKQNTKEFYNIVQIIQVLSVNIILQIEDLNINFFIYFFWLLGKCKWESHQVISNVGIYRV